MKGSAFLLIVLIAGLTVGGWWVRSVSKPGASSAPLKMQKAGQVLLADRIDTKHSEIFTTDPNMEREMRREREEEREKEYNSWEMLRHMYLFTTPAGQQPPSSPQGATPSQ